MLKKKKSVTLKRKIEISPPVVDIFGSYLVRLQYCIVFEVLAQMDNSNPLSDGVMGFAVTDLLHLVLGAQITNSGTDLKPPPSQKPPWRLQTPLKCV